MKRTISKLAVRLALILTALWLVVGASAQNWITRADGARGGLIPQFVQGEVLITFHEGTEEAVWPICGLIGARPVTFVPEQNLWHILLPRKWSVPMGLNFFARFPEVEAGQPNYTYTFDFMPNDPLYGQQYAPQITNCEPAWDIIQGDASTVIAILDTGVDFTHPDLQAKLLPGWNFGDNNGSPPQDLHGHGTACAGAAAAATNNGEGIAAPGFNCMILPVKVNVGAAGFVTSIAALRAIWWSASRADVISMSWGAPTLDPALAFAIQTSGLAIKVAAAGNENTSSPRFPAAYPNVISVGATNASDQKAPFSNHGNWVDVAAPGAAVLLPSIDPARYRAVDGTSFSCPFVAGALGLLSSYMGAGNAGSFVRDALLNTCDPVGGWLRYGRINVGNMFGYVPPGQSLFKANLTGMNVFWGNLVYGRLQQLNQIDQDRVIFDAGHYSGNVYVGVLDVDARVSYSGQPTEIRVVVTNRVTNSYTPSYVSLYRWRDGAKIALGSFISDQTDKTRMFIRTFDPQDYIDPNGNIRVRLQCDSVFPYQVETDLVRVSVVTQ